MPRPAGSRRAKGGPDPTKCVSPQCFDALVRSCVSCNLFRTPKPSSVVEPSSLAPRTPLQQQESVGTGMTAQVEPALPLSALLLGAPVLLGLALALALVLVALVTLRRRRSRGPASPEDPEREQNVGLHRQEGCAAPEACRTGMEKAVTQV